MNYPFQDPSRRVVLPRTAAGCKGLLIPKGVMIVNGVKEMVTPEQYADLSNRPPIHCPCGTKISHTGAHRVNGSFDVPDHFKTWLGQAHAPNCGFHFRKSARDLEQEDHEYDLAKPYRIHLNFIDPQISKSNLTRGTGQFYDRDSAGLPVNEARKDWQPVSIKSIDELVSFMAAADPRRLAQSLVILNQQAISWNEFCVSYRKDVRWTHLYNDLNQGRHFLRFFLLKKSKSEQPDLFSKDPHSLPMDQIKFSHGQRNIIINPRLNVSPETIELCARTGVVAVLTIAPNLQRAIAHTGAQAHTFSLNAQNPAMVARVDNLSLLVEAAQNAVQAGKRASQSPNPS